MVGAGHDLLVSYDILAFAPQATTDTSFKAWWDGQSDWSEDHDYSDPAVTTPALLAFYRELIATFPPMNGPDAPSDDELDADPDLEERVIDYTLGRQLIYGAAGWSQAETVAQTWERLGRVHGVAIAFVSDEPLRIMRP